MLSVVRDENINKYVHAFHYDFLGINAHNRMYTYVCLYTHSISLFVSIVCLFLSGKRKTVSFSCAAPMLMLMVGIFIGITVLTRNNAQLRCMQSDMITSTFEEKNMNKLARVMALNYYGYIFEFDHL